MLRANHYDAAFEAYLRRLRTAYVAVDESKRALMAEASLKSMDFIVYSPHSANLLVDVKGRSQGNGRQSESWVTVEDIHCLTQWEQVFGDQFRRLLVFAYEISAESTDAPVDSVVTFQGKRYAFYGVWVTEYRQWMKQRSSSWQTVWVPVAGFRQLRFPIGSLLQANPSAVPTSPSVPQAEPCPCF